MERRAVSERANVVSSDVSYQTAAACGYHPKRGETYEGTFLRNESVPYIGHCAEHCDNDAACVAFIFAQDLKECRLLGDPLTGHRTGLPLGHPEDAAYIKQGHASHPCNSIR